MLDSHVCQILPHLCRLWLNLVEGTDPYINAWYDTSYNEIGDKCAWTFGKLALDGGKANVEWNNHYYVVQQEWSDARMTCTLNE